MGLTDWIALAADSGEYGLEWLVLGISIVVCALVMLGILMTKQYRQREKIDVEKHYIANDELSWTELMRVLQ